MCATDDGKAVYMCHKYFWLNVSHCKQNIYREKKVSLWLLCGVQHTVIMADSETLHNIIVIILIIYFVYFLEVLVEL